MNRRSVAALQYFHTASSLIVRGSSNWEFMAESILNFCKTLQVLFGNSADDVRSGLSSLGFTSEEIEGDFVPLMILRNQFDVGHPKTAVPSLEQREILYEYLARNEIHFRQLFVRLLREMEKGNYEKDKPEDALLDPDEQRQFDKLIEKMQSRLGPHKGGSYYGEAIIARFRYQSED